MADGAEEQVLPSVAKSPKSHFHEHLTARHHLPRQSDCQTLHRPTPRGPRSDAGVTDSSACQMSLSLSYACARLDHDLWFNMKDGVVGSSS